jgi:3-hydroxymyristoyl/3-hydroxydecanoyl-(acyl carrier protein) dehydratase
MIDRINEIENENGFVTESHLLKINEEILEII